MNTRETINREYGAAIETALARHIAARARIERETNENRKHADAQLAVDLREAAIKHAAEWATARAQAQP